MSSPAERSWLAVLRSGPAEQSCGAVLRSSPAERSCRAALRSGPAEQSCGVVLRSGPAERLGEGRRRKKGVHVQFKMKISSVYEKEGRRRKRGQVCQTIELRWRLNLLSLQSLRSKVVQRSCATYVKELRIAGVCTCCRWKVAWAPYEVGSPATRCCVDSCLLHSQKIRSQIG